MRLMLACCIILLLAGAAAAEIVLDRSGTLQAGDPQLDDGSYYDRYVIIVNAGDRFQFDLTGRNYDPYLIVTAPDGAREYNDDIDANDRNSRLTLTFATGGQVIIYATSYAGNVTGSYRLQAQRLGSGGTTVTVAAQPAAGWIAGRLESGDRTHRDGSYLDYHEFAGRRGERVTIVLEADDFDPYLFLMGPDDWQQSNDDDGASRNCRLAVTLPADGTYYAVVNSYGEGAHTGAYRLRIDRGSGGTTTGAAAAAGGATTSLSIGRTVEGRLAAGDRTHRDGSYLDYYTFRGRAGQTITATLESSVFDPILFLQGPNDFSMQNDDIDEQNRNARIVATLPAAGEYRLIANSYGEGARTGAYTLTLAEGGSVTPANAPATGATRLQPGRSVNGNLRAGDSTLRTGEFYDMFSLEARAGQAFAVDLSGDGFDPYLFIRGPENFSEDNDDFNEDRTRCHIEFSAPAAGTYRVYVTSYRPAETGSYRLAVSDPAAGRVTVAAPAAGTTVLAFDRPVSGTLSPQSGTLRSGEYRDVYTFRGTAGEQVVLDLSSADFDAYLCLRGQGLSEDNDDARENARDARLVCTLPRTGEYQVFATTYQAGMGGTYRLLLSRGTGAPPVVTPPVDPPVTTDDHSEQWSVPTSVDGGRVFGIFVGISDYPGDGNDLPLCADDARKFADDLRQARVSSAAEQVVLLDRDATTGAVRRAFARLAPRVGPNDLFIFFYSGHGSQSEDNPSSPERDRREESLYLYDGELGDDEMGQLLRQVNCRIAVLALDACFSGGFRDALTQPAQLGLFSSEEDLTSAVPDKFQAGGYLSHFLRVGLLGASDSNRDNRVTAGELCEYLYRQYAQEVTGVSSETLEGAESYQHLVVDRGGVKVSDLLLSLAQVEQSLKYSPGSSARGAGRRLQVAVPANSPAAVVPNALPPASSGKH